MSSLSSFICQAARAEVSKTVLVKHRGMPTRTPFPSWLTSHPSDLATPAYSAEGSLLGPYLNQGRTQPQLTGLGTRAGGRGLSPIPSPKSAETQDIILQKTYNLCSPPVLHNRCFHRSTFITGAMFSNKKILKQMSGNQMVSLMIPKT